MTAELTDNDFRSSESGGVPSRPLSAVRNEDFGVKRDLQPAKPGRGSCLACGDNMIAEARANQWRGESESAKKVEKRANFIAETIRKQGASAERQRNGSRTETAEWLKKRPRQRTRPPPKRRQLKWAASWFRK